MARAAVPRSPAPITTPISDTDRLGRLTGYVPVPWSDYFNSLDAQLAGSYQVLDSQHLAASNVAVPPTPITSQSLPAGLYRVSYYLVELQPATTSSSVQVTIYWTDRGVTRNQTTPFLTGNATNVSLSNILLLRADASTPISYSVAYTSVGVTPLLYGLDVLLEQITGLS